MISGLIEGQEKMSKSNPDSAIFMEENNNTQGWKLIYPYAWFELTHIGLQEKQVLWNTQDNIFTWSSGMLAILLDTFCI